MIILEKRKIQKISNKNTLLVVIPKIVSLFLDLKYGDSLVFKKDRNKIMIEKAKKMEKQNAEGL